MQFPPFLSISMQHAYSNVLIHGSKKKRASCKAPRKGTWIETDIDRVNIDSIETWHIELFRSDDTWNSPWSKPAVLHPKLSFVDKSLSCLTVWLSPLTPLARNGSAEAITSEHQCQECCNTCWTQSEWLQARTRNNLFWPMGSTRGLWFPPLFRECQVLRPTVINIDYLTSCSKLFHTQYIKPRGTIWEIRISRYSCVPRAHLVTIFQCQCGDKDTTGNSVWGVAGN